MTRTSKKQNKRENAKTIRHPKSSPEARRFIEKAIQHCGNERDAATYLGLPNHGQLHAMKIGKIHDTPAMQAYIKLRKARAKRAYNRSLYSTNGQHEPTMIDAHLTLRAVRRDLEMALVKIDAILKIAS